MPLEVLLGLCLLINVATLLISFSIIKRFKKIAKLSTLIYEELAITKTDKKLTSQEKMHLKAQQQARRSKHILLQQQTSRPPEPNCDNIHTQVMTKSESHLEKVLQGKYPPEEGP